MKKRLLEIILKSLSIGILIYLIYKSEITWSGEQRFFYLKFFLVFLTINIIIFFYYKVSNATKKIIRTNLYTVLIIIYAFELFLNFILNNNNDIKHKADLLKKRGELFDERKKLEVYDSLIKDFPNAKLYVPPSNNLSLQNIEILPVSGVSNSKNLYCNENGYWFEFDSDRYGFNNPDEVWNKKQIEYLLLGDSYVMGACVNRPFDTASQIRKMSGKNVINLAMAGNGPLMQYASLREYVFSNTKNVIWHYSEANDNFELATRLKNPILKKYLDNDNFDQNLKGRIEIIDEMNETLHQKEISNQLKDKFREESTKYKILKFIQLKKIKTLFNFQTPKVSYAAAPPKQFAKILKMAKYEAEKKGANFYFVYLPRFERYSDDKFSDENYLKIISIVNDLNINLIDFKVVLENEKKPMSYFPFGMWGHYNEDGYKLLAKTIIENIN